MRIGTANINILEYIRKDRSSWGLIAANMAVIIMALAEGWDLMTVMVLYWIQNVIIGAFNVLKILSVKTPYAGVEIKSGGGFGAPARAFMAGKVFTAGFFAVHYGLFHFVYFEFLKGHFSKIDPVLLLISTGIFIANHAYSFVYNYRKDSETADLGKLMFQPYQRIIPMHITIIFGSMIMGFINGRTGERLALILFLGLKALADVNMHILEHSGTSVLPNGKKRG